MDRMNKIKRRQKTHRERSSMAILSIAALNNFSGLVFRLFLYISVLEVI